MIPINELRQGNYYRCKVYNGNNDVILPFTWQEYKYAHLFEPIPLTEEVLRAAGFEFKRGWKANGGEIDVDQYVLGQFDVAVASIGGIALTWRDRAINVQYLHQLQNLYFVLTGSELEVSLPLIGNSPIRDNK